jgi:hypothetical protein
VKNINKTQHAKIDRIENKNRTVEVNDIRFNRSNDRKYFYETIDRSEKHPHQPKQVERVQTIELGSVVVEWCYVSDVCLCPEIGIK